MVDAETFMKKQSEKLAAAKKGFGNIKTGTSNSASSSKHAKYEHAMVTSTGSVREACAASDSVSETVAGLSTVVRLNAVSGFHTDLVISRCRGEAATSFAGNLLVYFTFTPDILMWRQVVNYILGSHYFISISMIPDLVLIDSQCLASWQHLK
jgi:hypothetical protein